MPYPTIQQYRDVLQLPKGQRPLRSPELDGVCHGEIVPTKNPMFLHWGSGSFAAVFRCCEPSNAQLAVRCLLSAPPNDVAERCSALEDYRLQHAHEVPFLVRSQFVPGAIKVQGEWHPLFLMQWVEGRTLGAHIEQIAGTKDKGALSRLADKWQKLVASMENLHIAHGDLQHGNVMVTSQGELLLVDYDTVFLPVLAHRNAVAVGTAGYVHPSHLRAGTRPYDESMDKFGALVILLSLRALAFDPDLYGQFTQDNLLLSAEDLETPDASSAFQQLKEIKDAEVADLANRLGAACRQRQEPIITLPTFEPPGPAIPRVIPLAPSTLEYERGTAIRSSPVARQHGNETYQPSAAIPRTSSAPPASAPSADDYVPSSAIPKS